MLIEAIPDKARRGETIQVKIEGNRSAASAAIPELNAAQSETLNKTVNVDIDQSLLVYQSFSLPPSRTGFNAAVLKCINDFNNGIYVNFIILALLDFKPCETCNDTTAASLNLVIHRHDAGCYHSF